MLPCEGQTFHLGGGEVEIVPDEPLGLYVDFTLPYLFIKIKSISNRYSAPKFTFTITRATTNRLQALSFPNFQ